MSDLSCLVFIFIRQNVRHLPITAACSSSLPLFSKHGMAGSELFTSIPEEISGLPTTTTSENLSYREQL